MKKSLCILLSLVFLFTLCSCGEQEEEFQDPAQFYYLRAVQQNDLHHGSIDSVITPEIREAYGLRDDLTSLLELYLSGPASLELESPFPAGTALISCEVSGTTVSLVLCEDFADLSGMDLTLACACLTMTCLELTGTETVQIAAENGTLDGKAFITMDESILVLKDSSTVTEPDTT